MARTPSARRLAGMALLAVAAAAGCALSRPAPAPPRLPAGYSLYEAPQVGFRVGLAPGWRQAAAPAPDGVEFTDASGGADLLVHVEQARSPDLDTATGGMLFELTGGGGLGGAAEAATTLSGHPARHVTGGFTATAGAAERMDAVVMLEGGRAWALALAGPAYRLTADTADFDRIRASFQLLSGHPTLPQQVAVGSAAPAFPELARVRGPVVLNFFATWCGPCRQEMPLLARRSGSAAGRFSVLGMDTQDDASQVPAFLRELGVHFAIGYDRDGHLAQAYLLPGVPATFFLDAQHVVRNEVYGPLTADTLQQGLRAAGAA